MSACRALTLVAAMLVMSASATAATPERASLPDIEDEVMCPTCGVPLNQAFSPQAERERQFIRGQIAAGRTKEQIKQALVDEFGESVLATPRDEGFELAAYIVPAAAVALAAGGIAFGLVRWRRRARPVEELPEAPVSSAEAARLERDLSRHEL